MEYILETLGKVGFEWKMALFNLINFLLVFYILKRLFFVPILKVIEDRKRMAEETEENFKKSEMDVAMARRNSEEILEDAKKQANSIIGQAVTESSVLAESMRQRAKEDVAGIVAQAKTTIAAEKEQMQYELRKETAELVVGAVEKVLGEGVTDAIDTQLTNRLISDMQKS